MYSCTIGNRPARISAGLLCQNSCDDRAELARVPGIAHGPLIDRRLEDDRVGEVVDESFQLVEPGDLNGVGVRDTKSSRQLDHVPLVRHQLEAVEIVERCPDDRLEHAAVPADQLVARESRGYDEIDRLLLDDREQVVKNRIPVIAEEM